MMLLYRIYSYLNGIRSLKFIAYIMYKVSLFFFRCSIPPSVRIGKNTKLAYGGIGVVINKSAKIGDNCTIGQNVTLAGKSQKESGACEICNNVFIGANSVIIGERIIGSGSIIAPGSIVVADVPENVVVAGNPARIIRRLQEGEAYI